MYFWVFIWSMLEGSEKDFKRNIAFSRYDIWPRSSTRNMTLPFHDMTYDNTLAEETWPLGSLFILLVDLSLVIITIYLVCLTQLVNDQRLLVGRLQTMKKPAEMEQPIHDHEIRGKVKIHPSHSNEESCLLVKRT